MRISIINPAQNPRDTQGDAFALTVDSRTYTKRADAGNLLLTRLKKKPPTSSAPASEPCTPENSAAFRSP